MLLVLSVLLMLATASQAFSYKSRINQVRSTRTRLHWKLPAGLQQSLASNDMWYQNIGFNSDENEVTVLWPGGEEALPRAGKATVAAKIVEQIARRQQR